MRNLRFIALLFLISNLYGVPAFSEEGLLDYTACQSTSEKAWDATLTRYYCGPSNMVEVLARKGIGVVSITWFQDIEWDKSGEPLRGIVRHYKVEDGLVVFQGQYQFYFDTARGADKEELVEDWEELSK